MKILALDADDVASSLPMKECIEEMSRAFGSVDGSIQSPLRTRLEAESGDVLVMPSMMKRKVLEASVKVVSIFPKNTGKVPSISSAVLLVDGENGEVKAVMDGRSLTSIRTGAVSGLSCRYLARKDSRTLGVVGAGVQAFQQVNGVVTALAGIESVRVFSRTKAKSAALAKRCRKELGVDSSVEADVRECARSDVVVTATTAKAPVFDGRDVRPGTHVIAIGSFRPEVREVDSALVRRSTVFVDSRAEALEEAGDIIIPMKEGVVSGDAIEADLSELVGGSRKGRRDDSQVTFFKSVGLAFEDNAAGWLAYRRASRKRLGTWTKI